MKPLRQALKQTRTWVVLLLAIGILFRFYHLEYKVYWYDETQTSLRISGHTRQAMLRQVYDGEPIRVKTLLAQYQYPNADRDLGDTLDALSGSPEHAPLYFLSARFWLQLFGNSTLVIRSLSAIVSLLALPCMYWLCWELFKLPAVSWLATVLVAISPFHVLYAQEARQYSLWTVTILFSGAALLRAIRLRTVSGWALYAFSVALGLYTHTFSVLVMLGHGIYVALTQGLRLKQSGAYWLASLVGMLLFVPWLQIVIGNFSLFAENTASVNADRADLQLIWGLNLSRLFFDLNQGPSWINPVPYLLLALVSYAFYFLARQAPLRAWAFVITLAGAAGMALIVPDVILGGRRSSITRYAIPSFLAIEIAVAYLLTMKLRLPKPAKPPESSEAMETETFSNPALSAPVFPISPTAAPLTPTASMPSRHWRNITIALLLSGILSCAVSSQVQVWWHKSHSKSLYNPSVAKVINRSDRPLVITDQNPGMTLALAHLLKDSVRLQLVIKPEIPRIPDEFSAVYLYRPTANLEAGLKKSYRLESAYKDWLWQVKPK